MPTFQSSTIRIVIAESKEIARVGLRLELLKDKSFEIVGETGSADEALQLVIEHAPLILLVDFPLEGMPTIELIRQVYDLENNPTRVLVFTDNDSRARIMGALSAGAMGYLLKSERTSAVSDAIRQLAKNQTALSQSVQDILVDFAAQQQRDITVREDRALRMMALGLSDQEIATRLNVSENTVRHDLQNVCRKLPFIRTRAEAAAWAWMNNLILPNEGSATQ